MSWVRIDDAMPEHPKVLAAGPLAFALDVAAMCYSARNRTDGRIPRAKVRLLIDLADVRIGRAKADPMALADALVEAGRWRRDGDDFVIHDYLEYNPARDEIAGRTANLSEIRREAGRAGGRRSAEARAKQTASKTEAKGQASAQAKPKQRTKQTASKTQAPIPLSTHSPPNPPQGSDEAESGPESSLRPSSPAPAEPSAESASPEIRRILEAIEAHAVLAPVATEAAAAAIEGRRMSIGTPIDDVVEAIGECARDAAMAAAGNDAWDAPHMAKVLGRYCDQARNRRRRGSDRGRSADAGPPRKTKSGMLLQQDSEPAEWMQKAGF